MDILIAIIILGILIFVHELGHFLVAKLFGVYVEKFSLGFGPRIIGKQYGETDYCLSAFPLGGYVKMYGEQPDDEVDSSKEERAFINKPSWQRALIVLAGPIANILLAIVIFSGLYMKGYPTYEPIVGSVSIGSVAEKAGIKFGDKIVSVDDKIIRSWGEFQEVITDNPNKNLRLIINDNKSIWITTKEKVSKNIFGEDNTIGDIGVTLYIPPVLGTIHDGFPAADAGLKAGDRIISINDIDINTWNQATEIIRNSPNKALDIVIAEHNDPKSIKNIVLTPKLSSVKNNLGEDIDVGLVGINPADGSLMVKYNFIEAIGLGFEKSYEFTKLILLGLVKLIQRVVPADSLGGPIMIVQMAADSAESGLTTLLTFMAVISVNLAVFNLLPIPVLDGGHLLIMAIEAVTRRKMSDKVVGVFQTFGFIILMFLMVFAFYNDIARFFIK